MEVNCTIRELRKMGEDGTVNVEIYYAEDMTNVGAEWSVDVMQNRINDNCKLSWCWTVISLAEDLAYRKESADDTIPEEYEIIIDAPFSDDAVCEAIYIWLDENGLHDYNFNIKMIDLRDSAPYSGYIKSLMNHDIDTEIEQSVEFEEWLTS